MPTAQREMNSALKSVTESAKKASNSRCFNLPHIKELHGELEQLRAERYAANLWQRSGLSSRHRYCEKFTDDEWRDKLEKVEEKLGTGCVLLFCGPHGTGKTQLVAEVIWQTCARLAEESIELPPSQSQQILYTKLTDLFSAIKSANQPASKETELEVTHRFRSHCLLVVDEIHHCVGTSWRRRLFTHIVEDRHDNLLDTILIANEKTNGIRQLISSSILSRVNGCGGLIWFKEKLCR